MDAGFEASLVVDDVAFDADDAVLLRTIAEHGSVSGAASALGRSRARALARLDALEEALGPLVERSRGGAGGGGSRLTDDAWAVLARFDRLRAALSGTADADETVLSGTVTESAGELGLVETDAGAVRALFVDESTVPAGERVQVSLRADAVTLHDVADAPPDGATSARNRFRGRVAALEPGESVVRVAVDVGVDAPLAALVTRESVTRLDLTPGAAVVASFKATATRATRAEP